MEKFNDFIATGMNENISINTLRGAGVKINKPILEIPELLLAYTYFLNNCCTSHLTIGYDNESFLLRIILFKNNNFQILYEDDWNALFKNYLTIDNHFKNKYDADFAELPQTTTGGVQFKFSIRKGVKCLISVQNNKKLILEPLEWEKLFQWIPYFNSIISWYSRTTLEIQLYYDRYLQCCIQNNVLHLLPHQFLMSGDQSQYFYNSSRIFNEMPIICKSKLRNDIIDNYYDKKLNYEE